MLTLLIVFALNSFFTKCSSAPTPIDPIQVETIPWQSLPDVRGTFDLIASCTITLTLCIWTSLHLNIPAQNESITRRIIRRLRWTLVALLGPEFVVDIAWREWLTAKKLYKKVDQILKNSPNSDKVEWTLVHGFYATMGGFVFEIDPKTEPFIPSTDSTNKPIHLTLTHHGILLLAQCGRLPAIPKERIVDKGKADGLAKAFVCLQAAWSILQITGRLASHLPITLLEITTIGHVICALTIYSFWWSKPQAVSVPTVLSGDWTRPMCAYMWMRSRISGGTLASGYGQPEMEALYLSPNGRNDDKGNLPSSTRPPSSGGNEPRPSVDLATGQPPTIKPERQFFQNLELQQPSIGSPDLHRWRLASDALMRNPEQIKTDCRDFLMKPRSWRRRDLLTRRVKNYTPYEPSPTEWFTFFVPNSLALAYGGLHAAAWNTFFPTATEALMWRISCGIVFESILLLCIVITAFDFGCLPMQLEDLATRLLTAGAIGVYFPCKLFFIVESFISIRALPLDAYKTPDWTRFIPHF